MRIDAEVVFFYLYDAGRSIDLAKVARLMPTDAGGASIKNRRDTPESLTLPKSILVQLDRLDFEGEKPFARICLAARVFEEGAISMNVRVTGKFAPEELHRVRSTPFAAAGETVSLDAWVDESMKRFFARIQEAITFEQYAFSTFVRETYAAYCVTSPIGNPAAFVAKHRKTIACLLNGERYDADIHESLVEATLKGAFSYTARDYALFDLDRCLIIDPNRDYEDILLVVEQANFQLLELRALDLLLDRWLEKAEADIKVVFKKNTARLKMLRVKLESVQALSFDALFILENLENSSKIIGDYFLGQIFTNLCGQFNTEGWKRSIERRLATLGSVYERVSAHDSERRMVILEIMFIAVCVIFPVIQIIQVFLVS